MADAVVSRETTSAEVFGDRLELARRFAEILRTDGIVQGLVGPREADRVWERHVLNCAAVAPAIPHGATVLDVGSGAGLPGLVLAIARPDAAVTLLEPLQRRVSFLEDTITALGLPVEVVRGRAEDMARRLAGPATDRRPRRRTTGAGPRRGRDGRAGTVPPVAPQAGMAPGDVPIGRADIVTARAVARLGRLVEWCLPLVRPGGSLLAVKGDQAAAELQAAEGVLAQLGAGSWQLEDYLIDDLRPATRVIRVTAADIRAR